VEKRQLRESENQRAGVGGRWRQREKEGSRAGITSEPEAIWGLSKLAVRKSEESQTN